MLALAAWLGLSAKAMAQAAPPADDVPATSPLADRSMPTAPQANRKVPASTVRTRESAIAAVAAPRQSPRPTLALSLADAVFIGLRKNTTIRGAYLDRIVQRFDLKVSENVLETQGSQVRIPLRQPREPESQSQHRSDDADVCVIKIRPA